MEIKVGRYKSVGCTTLGEMWIDGVFFCYTLEDEIRPLAAKIWGKTAINEGKYSVVNSYSNRFKQYMPELLAVPNFKGVRIHAGNSVEDSHGCILVGYSYRKDGKGYEIYESRNAYRDLVARISKVEKTEKITIEIINLKKDAPI